jgi:ATP-dependent protease HslVU (ClpYQ) ATPase subunit
MVRTDHILFIDSGAFHAVADDLSRLLDCTAGDEPVQL